MPIDKTFTVTLTCHYCRAELKKDSGVELKAGDKIDCTKCGRSNDYNSLKKAATEKAKDRITKQAVGDLRKELKKSFKLK